MSNAAPAGGSGYVGLWITGPWEDADVFGSLPRTAGVLLCVRVLNQLGGFALPFLAVLAGPRSVTAALTVFGVAALVSRWAGGVMLDRFAPRAVVAGGLGATGAALTLLTFARGPGQTLAAVALTGLAFEIYEPATSELLARVTSADARRAAYTALGTTLTAAGALSGLLAAVLLPFGVRPLLLADAVTCLAAAAVALVLLPPGHLGEPRPRPARWRPPLVLIRMTASATAFAFGYLAVMMFTPYVLLTRGAPPWLPGLTLAASALVSPVAARFARRFTIPLGMCVLGVLSVGMAATSDVPLTVAAYIAWAMTGGVFLGYWPALAAEHAPADDRPRWFAFLGLSWGIAQPAVPAVTALIAGGTPTTALLTGGLAFLTVPLLAVKGTTTRVVRTSRPGR